MSSVNSGSGIMNVVMNLYRNIDRAKIQFDFLYLEETPSTCKSEIAELGGRIFYIEKPGLLSAKHFISRMDAFFREHARDYAVIHLHELLINAVCLGLAKKHGINHRIVHAHATKYSDKKINALRNYFLCLTLKKYANILFACSRKAGEFLFGRADVKNGKVHILNNAIDCEKYGYNPETRRKVRKELRLENCFVIGHVGRLWKQKNHAFLLDIFFELYKTEKDAVLLLAGSGELEREIRDKAHRQGINKSVIFLGNRSDVRDLLQAMDVFVLPSFFEGLPLTLVEAQASGLRCFTSTNVTEEAKVTDLVRYISLSKSAAFWADTISACRGYERQDAAILVKNNGYDIKDVAGKLTQYYSKLAGRA